MSVFSRFLETFAAPGTPDTPPPPTVPADTRCIKIDLDMPSKSTTTGGPAVAGLASPDAARADAERYGANVQTQIVTNWSIKTLNSMKEILDRSEGSGPGSMISLSVKEAVMVSNLGWVAIAKAKAETMAKMRRECGFVGSQEEDAVPHHRAEDAAMYEMHVVADLMGKHSVSWIREILLGVHTVTIKKTM